jgi:hypothetical protein
MFVPLLTPGALLSRQGRQEAIEEPVGTGSSSHGEGTQDVLVNEWDGDSGIPPAILGVGKLSEIFATHSCRIRFLGSSPSVTPTIVMSYYQLEIVVSEYLDARSP